MGGHETYTDRELTRDDLDRLVAAGIVRGDRGAALVAAFRESVEWRGWLATWVAALGGTFVLAGIIFFFAWNWKEMSPLVRFGVLGGGVALASVGAAVAGKNVALRQWCLMTAAVLTGVLLAVYGQVYQTGADAFEVFALWAALIIGWVVTARFAPLWLLWLAVLQTAMATYGGQVLVPEGVLRWPAVFLAIGGVMAAFLLVREWLAPRAPFGWLEGEWLRIALVAATLFWLTAVPWQLIFRHRWEPENPWIVVVLGTLAWTAAVIGGAIGYTRFRPSLTCVGLCVLSALGISVTAFAERVFDASMSDAGAWLLVGIFALAASAGAAVLIGRAARSISHQESIPQR